MTDLDRIEIRSLCSSFRQMMVSKFFELEPPAFDHEAKLRFGTMISRAVRQRDSQFAYCER
jgi:hypothetical protein